SSPASTWRWPPRCKDAALKRRDGSSAPAEHSDHRDCSPKSSTSFSASSAATYPRHSSTRPPSKQATCSDAATEATSTSPASTHESDDTPDDASTRPAMSSQDQP